MSNSAPSENALIPSDFGKALAATFAADAAVQSCCTAILSQPDVHLDGIPELAPSQRSARESASHWLDSLHPQLLGVFTQVKEFTSFYGAMSESDIEQLVADLNSPGGKAQFREVMLHFHQEAALAAESVGSTAAALNGFAQSLDEDLRPFRAIADEAHTLYGAADSKFYELFNVLSALSEAIRSTDVALVAETALMGEPRPSFLIRLGWAVAGQDTLLRATLTTAGAPLQEQTSAQSKARQALAQEHDAVLGDLYALQSQAAALYVLDDSYRSLAESSLFAASELAPAIDAFTALRNNFAGLADLVQGLVDSTMVAELKVRLSAALQDAAALHAFAEERERNSRLPVMPDDDLARTLQLPSSWSGQQIPGDTFTTFVNTK
ncbi:HBL/NHE enterotoxin family protein [Streptomyces sp. NPDC048445]|uniref:HBL/NHE enterotoxin family protein n=1 Tax=unclassified Streptomyces TaxID=2593676 RepID=UPI0037154C51